MSYPPRDNKDLEILHNQTKKILGALPTEDAKALHALISKAGESFDSHSGDELRQVLAGFQAALLAMDRQNHDLKHKLHVLTSELGETNLALTRNIEELQRSKQLLKEREARLASIINAAVEGIITIDPNGSIVSANASVNTLFGYGQEELIGQNISRLMPIEHAKKHDGYIENYLKTRTSKAIGTIREVEGIRKDGSSVPLDISLAEFTVDGKHFFTAILRDASLRKLQQRHDREHLEELAHVSRLGLMGEMASGIAHEVNQPLTAICAYTQVCLDLVQTGGDQKQLAAILDKTHQQAFRAGQIIHRMRDFTRSKTHHRSSVDINALIQDCATLCAFDIKQHNITFRFNPANNLPFVYIDEIQIEQVLLNLIRNSFDALKTLPHSLPKILTIRTRMNDQDNIEISVKDNGPGIEETDRAKIFTPFYTTKTNGTGMGLSISRSIVEAHHGVFRFNSAPGKGATFYFTLPSRRNCNEF